MKQNDQLRRALVLAACLALLVVVGEAGHVLLDQLNAVIAHHFFHLVFPAVAFIAFGLLVASDIRQRGWPTFSWRLQSELTGRPGPAPESGRPLRPGWLTAESRSALASAPPLHMRQLGGMLRDSLQVAARPAPIPQRRDAEVEAGSSRVRDNRQRDHASE